MDRADNHYHHAESIPLPPTPGAVNPRRAYDWRAGSDADYLRAVT